MSINYRNGPSSNENHNRIPTQHVHPEAMPSSQTLAGERRPGDPVHPMDVDPSRKSKRTLKIAATAMVGSVIIAAGSYLSLKSDENDEIKQLGTPNGESSAPVVPGVEYQPADPTTELESTQTYTIEQLDEMSPNVFAKLDTTTRLDYALDTLIEDRPAALAILNKYATPKEKVALADFSTKEQTILNNNSADVLDASAQGQDLEDVNFGMKLLSATMSPDNQNFSSTLSQIPEEPMIKGVFEANSEYRYDTITDTTFMDRPIGSEGAEVIRAVDLDNGEDVLMLFEKATASNGESTYIYTANYNLVEAPQLEYELQRFRVK